jgi:hypothetical protein
VLVAREIITREVVIEYFEKLFSIELAKEIDPETEAGYFVTDLILNSTQIYPLELNSYINRAFEADLVDPFSIDRDDIEFTLQKGRNNTLQELREEPSYFLIENTIGEMQNWDCFVDRKLFQTRHKPVGLSSFNPSPSKKFSQSKKKTKQKMQKQSRRQNRTKKK